MAPLLAKFSTVPLIFIIQALATGIAARRAARLQQLHSQRSIHIILLTLALWGICISWLALSGALAESSFLNTYPAIWMPFVPVVLTITIIALFPEALSSIRSLIDATAMQWLIAIHALRILAIGGIIKALRGEFPVSFATWVGGPDFLFGLSAVVVSWLVIKKRIGTWGLIVWNAIGVLVILPAAPLVGQMGLPGLLHGIDETPSSEALFAFPMVLAPALVVPVFVMINMFVAFRLIERAMESK